MSIKNGKVLLDLSKLEPLDVSNYRRWSQKLLIFFQQLEVDYILTVVRSDKGKVPKNGKSTIVIDLDSSKVIDLLKFDQSKSEPTVNPDKFEKDNKTVRGNLLNHMTHSLFDFFVVYKSIKLIQDTLKSRYEGNDAGHKKYVVGKWLQFQMIDVK